MELYEAAREYLGIQFKHQGRYEHGVDCGGLLILAARKKGIFLQDITGYYRMPDDVELKNTMDAQLIKVSRKPQPNDILLMAFHKNPQHIAIVTPKGIIHAYEGVGKVVEHNLDERWLKRIRGVYTL